MAQSVQCSAPAHKETYPVIVVHRHINNSGISSFLRGYLVYSIVRPRFSRVNSTHLYTQAAFRNISQEQQLFGQEIMIRKELKLHLPGYVRGGLRRNVWQIRTNTMGWINSSGLCEPERGRGRFEEKCSD
jgi:hypothetical protein